ncbi:Retinol dehydrogenase 11 [Gryllus bimaculatus]|nr:Retinol dehydrogenase 11 [Gryllus bimaculatus]
MALWAWLGPVIALLAVMFIYAAFQMWYKMSTGVCTSKRRLDGCTVLVTGANTGIGLETAKEMARRGARVLLACRSPQRGQAALEEVRRVATKDATVALLALDLESLESVRACAAHVLATEPRLDVLINNAGAAFLSNAKTADGLHTGLQVNHFGPFLFTLLLVELLKKSAPSRIIFVSSVAHEYAKLKPEQLEYDVAKKIGDTQIYAMTKLANVLISNEFARRLSGTGVTVNSLHPGAVKTEVYRNLPAAMATIVDFGAGLFMKTPTDGAQTTIHLAVSEKVEGVTGSYFSDCKEKRMAKAAYDVNLARAIWEKSEQLMGLQANKFPSVGEEIKSPPQPLQEDTPEGVSVDP